MLRHQINILIFILLIKLHHGAKREREGIEINNLK